MTEIQYMETPLSIQDKFKLVVIAHEGQAAVRDAAIRVLSEALNPLVTVKPDNVR